MPQNTAASISSLLPSNVTSAEYLRLLADRDTSVLAHPALVYAGDAMGLGSLSIKLSQLGLDGYRLLEAVADGAMVGDSAIDDDDCTVTVAPYRKSYPITDLAAAVSQGKLGPQILARDAVMSAGNTLLSLVCAVFSGFSQQSGATGQSMTYTYMLQAKNALGARSVPGPYLAVISGIQFGHFLLSLAGAATGLAFTPASQAQIDAYGEGYKGEWAGVSIFVSNRVNTANAGADHLGAMWGRGAIVWADSSFAPEPDPNIVDFGGSEMNGFRGKVRFERDREARAGETAYVTHANLGVNEGIDLAGQGLLSKATA